MQYLNFETRDNNSIIVIFLVLSAVLISCFYHTYRVKAEQALLSTNNCLIPATNGQDKIILAPCRTTDDGSDKSTVASHAPFFFDKIPINSADFDLLMTVKGVGPHLAKNILQYRKNYGLFESSTSLLNLKGVGEKRVDYFENQFSFEKE